MAVSTPTDTTKETMTMTKTQILAQLADLVDGYIEANAEHGDAAPTTHDMILATYHSITGQSAIDEVSPLSVVQYEAGESTDETETVVTVGDEVEVVEGEHVGMYGTVVGFDLHPGITNVVIETQDEALDATVTVTVHIAEIVA